MMKLKLSRKKRRQDYHYIITKEQPLSYVSESLQKAIVNLEYVNVDGKYKTIQLTSTLSTEGKTTLAVNLAHLLAQRGKKVLLMDLDLRKPKLQEVTLMSNENGLNDYLLDKIGIDKLINKSKDLGFDFTLTGTKTTAISNILSSQKLKDLINKLKQDYDYIFIDTPPVLAVSDALLISGFVDGVIFVVAQNFALKKDVRDSYMSLYKTNANIIGTILTQVKTRGKRYNGYYEYE